MASCPPPFWRACYERADLLDPAPGIGLFIEFKDQHRLVNGAQFLQLLLGALIAFMEATLNGGNQNPLFSRGQVQQIPGFAQVHPQRFFHQKVQPGGDQIGKKLTV